MMLDAEQEREDEMQANGWRPPCKLTTEHCRILTEARLRRAREDAATCVASDRYYTLTARGRLAAERVDAAACAQLERTKETA